MSATSTIAALLILAAACAANGARMTPDLVSIGKDTFAYSNNVLQHWIHHHKHKGDSKDHAYVAVRYYVEPEDKDGFVKAWSELEDEVDDEEGNIIYDLKTPLTNNVEFIVYGEWKSFKDFMNHYESDYVREFEEYLNEHDIAFTVEPLTKPDVGELRPSKDQEDERQQAHALVRYTVPPSATEKFLDAWNQAEKAVEEEEEGAHIYSLRKVFWSNDRYYAYGTWDSLKDFHEHFESDHVQELLDALDEAGVVWHLAPLEKIGDQPE